MAAKEISVTRYVVRAVRGADQEGKEPGEKVGEGSDMLKADVCDDELWHKEITGCPASTSTSKNGTQRGTTTSLAICRSPWPALVRAECGDGPVGAIIVVNNITTLPVEDRHALSRLPYDVFDADLGERWSNSRSS